ncbi:MAG: hypothetical protein R3A48_09820 [Polyangiales bacterium]
MSAADPRDPLDEALPTLPELPPLDDDDAPLGGALGDIELDDAEADLDDAASDLAFDAELDEAAGGLDDAAGGLDLGADDADIAFDEALGGHDDDEGIRSFALDLDLDAHAEAPGDRGEDGPMEELLPLAPLPPLDDEDDEAPRAARPREATAAVTALPVDDVVAVAVQGTRVALLAGELWVRELDVAGGGAQERIPLPDELCGGVEFDRAGAPALVALSGAVFVLDADGGWRESLAAEVGARDLAREGGRLWARTRSGALCLVGEAESRPGGAPRRVVAWAADPAGSLAVVDGAARGELLRLDDGTAWRRAALPSGLSVSRLALRGAVIAALDGGSGRCWLSVDDGERWRELETSPSVEVAMVESDDGRATLLLAGRREGGLVEVSSVDCEDPARPPRRVALLRGGEGDPDPPSVTLAAVGREGVLCVALVEGVAYVVALS